MVKSQSQSAEDQAFDASSQLRYFSIVASFQPFLITQQFNKSFHHKTTKYIDQNRVISFAPKFDAFPKKFLNSLKFTKFSSNGFSWRAYVIHNETTEMRLISRIYFFLHILLSILCQSNELTP